MTLSLRQLRALTVAVETGSFGQAAARLHVSQPALTVQIRTLEETLGLTLFERSARGVRPTEAGRALAQSFGRVLDDLDQVVTGAREQAARRSGTVHLAVLPSVASTVLPAALARLRQAHPAIRVMVRDAVARRVGEMVKAGEAELGVGTLPGPDAALTAESCSRMNWSPCCRPATPWRAGGN
jgi:LysR family carnitine catabolism transcriptional activator